MPFGDGTFDGIVCQRAFQNFSRPEAALPHLRRVLKPGGEAVVIEMRREVPSQLINQQVRKANGIYSADHRPGCIPAGTQTAHLLRGSSQAHGIASGFDDVEILREPIFLQLWLSESHQ